MSNLLNFENHWLLILIRITSPLDQLPGSFHQPHGRRCSLQCGPGEPWPTQNFGWVGHSAFGSTNNWPVCSLILHCCQLIFRKISKIVDIRCQIVRLKCIKFAFLCPRPHLVSLQRSPRLIALFKGPTFKRGRGEGKVKGAGGRGRDFNLAHPKFWHG